MENAQIPNRLNYPNYVKQIDKEEIIDKINEIIDYLELKFKKIR